MKKKILAIIIILSLIIPSIVLAEADGLIYPMIMESSRSKPIVVTKTDNYTITLTDLANKIFRMNSTANKTFTLPSVGAADDGKEIPIENINTGKLTIDAADTDYIHNSGAGDGIYTISNKASIILKYCHSATMWRLKNAVGPWVTYD